MQCRKQNYDKPAHCKAEASWKGTGANSNPYAVIADPEDDVSISPQANDETTASVDMDCITNAKDMQDSITSDGTEEKNETEDILIDEVSKDAAPSETKETHPILNPVLGEEEKTTTPSSTQEHIIDARESAGDKSARSYRLPPMSNEAKAAAAKAKTANNIYKAKL